MFGSSNPILKEESYRNAEVTSSDYTMTVGGTINKTLILFFILLLGAMYTWRGFFMNLQAENQGAAYDAMITYVLIGLVGGFIMAMITIFAKRISPITTPIYAALEGLFLGGISAMFELRYPGLVMQAIGLTFGVMFVMLVIYRTGIIKVTDKFMAGVLAATGAICLVYLASMVMGIFGMHMPYIHSSGPIGIGISIFIVIIASLNLVIDFHMIEQGAQYRAPKYMEWYGAFGLMVTLVWLYLEILRLLSKLKER